MLTGCECSTDIGERRIAPGQCLDDACDCGVSQNGFKVVGHLGTDGFTRTAKDPLYPDAAVTLMEDVSNRLADGSVSKNTNIQDELHFEKTSNEWGDATGADLLKKTISHPIDHT